MAHPLTGYRDLTEAEIEARIVYVDRCIERVKRQLGIGIDWDQVGAIQECEERLRTFDTIFRESQNPALVRQAHKDDDGLITPLEEQEELPSDSRSATLLEELLVPCEQEVETLSDLFGEVSLNNKEESPQPLKEPVLLEEALSSRSTTPLSDDEKALVEVQLPAKVHAVTAYKVKELDEIILVHRCPCETFCVTERVKVPYVSPTNLPVVGAHMVAVERHQGTFGWLLRKV